MTVSEMAREESPSGSTSYPPVGHLFNAARSGNLEFLKKLLDMQSELHSGYFLSHTDDEDKKNMIHLAAKNGREEFIQVALDGLPKEVSLDLLCNKKDGIGNIPLHWAAEKGHLPTVKLIVKLYKVKLLPFEQSQEITSSDPRSLWPPPWLARNDKECTPLHRACRESKSNFKNTTQEEMVSYLLDLDLELLCNNEDDNGYNPLYYAVKKGLHGVAEKILNSGYQCSLVGPGWNVLHLVSTSSKDVCRILLHKHPELLEQNNNSQRHTVLHKWAYEEPLWPLEVLVSWKVSCILDMICKEDVDGDNPLHAAASENIQYAKVLNDAYNRAITEAAAHGISIVNHCPWTQRNKCGYTPFHFALWEMRFKQEEGWLIDIMSNNATLCHIHNNIDVSLLGIALTGRFQEVTKNILEIREQEELFSMPLMNDGSTVLHYLTCTTVETAKVLLEKFWWLIDKADSKGNTPMDILVSEELVSSHPLMSLLNGMKRNPKSIKRTFFNLNTLISASDRGQLSVLLPYIDHCPNLVQICRDEKDTPLHHIKLENPSDYEQFLANAKIKQMMNICDDVGATPLHKAIVRKEKTLVEALLGHDGVNKSIKDNNGNTAIELLRKHAKDDEDWAEICTRIIGIDPRIKTRFIEYPTKQNLGEIRATLSVIAALLATLTFAAGFTVPGGFRSDGEVVLGKDFRFLVFLLADTFAMCCSMLVLFFLMWSMMCKSDTAVRLIDNSVMILILSLYGTLLAFITGVYSIIFRMTLWAAIVIILMCSIIGLLANPTIFFKGVKKLKLVRNYIRRRPQIRDVEQGSEGVASHAGEEASKTK